MSPGLLAHRSLPAIGPGSRPGVGGRQFAVIPNVLRRLGFLITDKRGK